MVPGRIGSRGLAARKHVEVESAPEREVVMPRLQRLVVTSVWVESLRTSMLRG